MTRVLESVGMAVEQQGMEGSLAQRALPLPSFWCFLKHRNITALKLIPRDYLRNFYEQAK